MPCLSRLEFEIGIDRERATKLAAALLFSVGHTVSEGKMFVRKDLTSGSQADAQRIAQSLRGGFELTVVVAFEPCHQLRPAGVGGRGARGVSNIGYHDSNPPALYRFATDTQSIQPRTPIQ